MKFAYIRLMIKASLFWLILGSAIGIILFLQRKYINIPLYILPSHSHIILVGFLIQFIFGVAFWMFPRMPGGIFTSPSKGWLIFTLINLGTLTRGILEPIFQKSEIIFWLAFSGGIMQLFSIFIGALEISKRVRNPS